MYENDEIDITGVGLADLTRVQDPTEELNKDLVRVPPHFSISYIGFNVNEPPFDDPKFRQALNYAVDKELIASQVYSDLVMPAYGILPPGFPPMRSRASRTTQKWRSSYLQSRSTPIRRPGLESP